MMAYQFIRANKDRYAVKETAGLLGASRGAYYRWAVNGASQRRRAEDAELVRLILEIVTKHHRRYGSPRCAENFAMVAGSGPALRKQHV
jgi:hypothetical protein